MGEIELACHASAWPEDEFVMSLAGVDQAGFRAIEAWADVVPLFEDRIAVFQEMLAQAGVTLAAIQTRLRPLTADLLEEEVERCANVARFLRANRAEVLVLSPPPRRTNGDEAEEWKLAVEAINQVGRRTLDLDVRTCVLPGHQTIAQTKRETERLLENTEPEFVRLCFDTAYLTWAGISAPHFAKKFGSRIDFLHLQDIRKPRPLKSGMRKPERAAFGKGVVKMKSLPKIVDALDYDGWITLLCPGPHADPVAVTDKARVEVRHLFGLV